PHGAQLFIDGRTDGPRSPSVFDSLEVGREHTVIARLDGHKDFVRRFTVKHDEQATLTLSLQRAHGPVTHVQAPPQPTPEPAKPAAAPPPVSGEGALAIVSNPWCTVTVDGSERGQTPLNLKLAAGPHTVVLTNNEYKIRRQITVRIAPNET